MDQGAPETSKIAGVSPQLARFMSAYFSDAERSQESIDALLDDFCAGAARPIVIH